MCGVFSIFTPSGGFAPDVLTRAARAMHHRGPDGKGEWMSPDGRAGLAHARLSIIDLSGGAQPITNEDGTIAIVVNGEFYGYRPVREALKARGHVFKTESDSEIALHLYEEYGDDFVHHLRGEFALILYDRKAGRMVAARDRFGVKPLVYTVLPDGGVAFASEAKAIFAAGLATPQWDEAAYFHACAAQYLPADRTLFQGVAQLRPGMMAVATTRGLDIAPYWDMDYPVTGEQADIPDFAAATTQVHDTLYEAVTLRLQADVPVCCHLSGGIDSATIAGMAAHATGNAIDCFTVSFAQGEGQTGYDEFPVAQEQAALIGARLHKVALGPHDLVDAIADAVAKTEGLAVNGHLAGKYALSAAIRKAGFIVTLSGEGSDEIFAGYPHFREDILRAGQTAAQPDGTMAAHLQKLYASNDKLAGLFLAHGESLDTAPLAARFGFTPSFLAAKATLGHRINALLSPDYKARMAGQSPYDDLAAFFDAAQLTQRGPVDVSSYLWTRLTLANYILKTLGDGCEMAHSIEGRVPFLDHRVFECVRGLPLDYKIKAAPDGTLVEKHILREAAKPYLTPTLYKRQKHPFIAPPVVAAAAMRDYAGDVLHSQAMTAQPFFDPAAVCAWFDALPRLSGPQQVAAEPVLMTILTTLAAQTAFFTLEGRQSHQEGQQNHAA